MYLRVKMARRQWAKVWTIRRNGVLQANRLVAAERQLVFFRLFQPGAKILRVENLEKIRGLSSDLFFIGVQADLHDLVEQVWKIERNL